MGLKRNLTVGFLLLLAPALPFAQQSPGHTFEEHALNEGGAPEAGLKLSSPRFRLSLASIGGAPALTGLSSPTFTFEGGLVVAYPPPGEVTNVRFLDTATLAWDGEISAVSYHRYQALVNEPIDPAYGSCVLPAAGTNSATISELPAAGQAFFVLITAVNRLRVEGTKGNSSAGLQRPNPSPCP